MTVAVEAAEVATAAMTTASAATIVAAMIAGTMTAATIADTIVDTEMTGATTIGRAAQAVTTTVAMIDGTATTATVAETATVGATNAIATDRGVPPAAVTSATDTIVPLPSGMPGPEMPRLALATAIPHLAPRHATHTEVRATTECVPPTFPLIFSGPDQAMG